MEEKKKKHKLPSTAYKKIHQKPTCEQIQKYAACGLSIHQMAACLDMSHDTLERFFKEDPELHASIEKGKAVAITGVAGSLYNQAMKGNLGAQIFYLKTRAGWKETQVVENKPDDETQTKLDKAYELIRQLSKDPTKI